MFSKIKIWKIFNKPDKEPEVIKFIYFCNNNFTLLCFFLFMAFFVINSIERVTKNKFNKLKVETKNRVNRA